MPAEAADGAGHRGPDEAAHDVVAALIVAGRSVATAESLTGGLVCAALTDVPGASAVVRGGVIAYATDAKASVLGVDTALLERHGAVAGETAAAMAEGVRALMTADIGVATTGVAGPDAQEGHEAGTVHIAVATAAATTVVSRVGADRLAGDRWSIRRQSVELAVEVLAGRAGRES